MGVDEAEGLADGLARDDERGAQQRRQQGAEGVREVLEEGVDQRVLTAGLARAAALTSASDSPEPEPEEPLWLFIAGRLLISSYTLCTAPPMTIW